MIKGMTGGVFDLLHAGHIEFFYKCKEKCDHLTVALEKDPSNRPKYQKPSAIMSLHERYAMLLALKPVDSVVVFDAWLELIELSKLLAADIGILGGDWIGKEIPLSHIPVEYIERSGLISSTIIKKRIKERY